MDENEELLHEKDEQISQLQEEITHLNQKLEQLNLSLGAELTESKQEIKDLLVKLSDQSQRET